MPVLFHCTVALAVLLLDLAAGSLRARFAPVGGPPVLLARAALSLSRRLNRRDRSDATLRVRGVLLVGLVGGGALLMGLGLDRLAIELPYPLGLILESAIFWSCIRAHLPLARLRAASRDIEGRPDQTAFAGRALEQTARSFVHFVAAPLFWFILGGLPALLTASAAWAADRAGREGSAGANAAFGAPTAAFGRIVAWIPSRICEVILIVASALVPKGRPVAALAGGWGSLRLLGERSTAAALAGGLGLALPGPPRSSAPRIWIGGGRTSIGRADLVRAVFLYRVALLIGIGLIALAALLASR